PSRQRDRTRCKPRLSRLTLLVLGMFALQIVLDKGHEDDWFASSVITGLTVIAVLGPSAFVIWELRRSRPIVDLALLGVRSFAIGNLLMFMLGFVLLSTTVLLPLFVQEWLGYTATDAGLRSRRADLSCC